jgi:biopolymer transport protein ExbD
MKLGMILLLTATALIAATACKGVRTPSPQPLPYPNVYLPRNFKHADPSPTLENSAVVVSILNSTHIWVGPKEYSDLNGSGEIENAVRQAQQKTVYVRAAGTLDYLTIVKAIAAARRAGALEFALLVQMPGAEPDRQFTIKVLPRPWEGPEKTNPTLIGVILSTASKISLVKGGFEDGPVGPGGSTEDIGTMGDTSRLAQTLAQALAGRTDRTVTINAYLSTPYDHVLTIIDGVKGAGAHPIVLQIDDLRQ